MQWWLSYYAEENLKTGTLALQASVCACGDTRMLRFMCKCFTFSIKYFCMLTQVQIVALISKLEDIDEKQEATLEAHRKIILPPPFLSPLSPIVSLLCLLQKSKELSLRVLILLWQICQFFLRVCVNYTGA